MSLDSINYGTPELQGREASIREILPLPGGLLPWLLTGLRSERIQIVRTAEGLRFEKADGVIHGQYSLPVQTGKATLSLTVVGNRLLITVPIVGVGGRTLAHQMLGLRALSANAATVYSEGLSVLIPARTASRGPALEYASDLLRRRQALIEQVLPLGGKRCSRASGRS